MPVRLPQPFARGQGKAFTDGQPYLGGQIRVLIGPIAANVNYALNHNLRVIPRFCMVLDAGTGSVPSPLPRGATAWNASSISLNLPAIAAGQNVTLWLA